MLGLPVLVGVLPTAGIGKKKQNLLFMWITGQILLWAVFQLLCVPMVLKQVPFGMTPENRSVFALVPMYLAAAIALAAVSVCMCVKRISKAKSFAVIHGYQKPRGKWYTALWIVFWMLLLFQLVRAVCWTYADGDDAFYVAVAAIAEESDTMYMKLPYTGGSTGLDSRHGLAPFPIWIAFLARIADLSVVTVAHVAVPLMLIPMTYGIYYLIGMKLFRKKKEHLPLFLVLTQILVLFGDYSFYSVENFMIARSRQGKAALGSIIFPMMVFLFLMILDRMQEQQKIEFIWWLLLTATVLSACLCSTLGAFLSCLLTGVTGICTAAVYRKWKFLIPMAACCLPAVGYALLYLMLS